MLVSYIPILLMSQQDFGPSLTLVNFQKPQVPPCLALQTSPLGSQSSQHLMKVPAGTERSRSSPCLGASLSSPVRGRPSHLISQIAPLFLTLNLEGGVVRWDL